MNIDDKEDSYAWTLLAAVALFLIFVMATSHAKEAREAPVIESSEHDVIDVAFSPNYGKTDCTELCVATIDGAANFIYGQAYNFTSPAIAEALIRATKRGVDVKIILDNVASHEKGCKGEDLCKAGAVVYIDHEHKIAHNKVMVIDGDKVITGSFNFTTNAEEHNAENLLIIHNKNVAALYLSNWAKHQVHSDQMGTDAEKHDKPKSKSK